MKPAESKSAPPPMATIGPRVLAQTGLLEIKLLTASRDFKLSPPETKNTCWNESSIPQTLAAIWPELGIPSSTNKIPSPGDGALPSKDSSESPQQTVEAKRRSGVQEMVELGG